MVTEGVQTLGGKHTMEYIDDVQKNVILLTNFNPINLTNK